MSGLVNKRLDIQRGVYLGGMVDGRSPFRTLPTCLRWGFREEPFLVVLREEIDN